MKHGL